ncbi:MAG: prepilin-type N-terminal cleavage/methylation domain-containing protein [Actinobacteria bacterium]|nr:prepilin-type N-terminal cleavage/methylation domain-containing protein [Actinomycetota bacterium]
MMHRSKGSKGFTLIELMIVILIIAILVAIAIPVFLAARANAQRRTCQANLRTLEGACSTYMADANVYPGTLADMETGLYKVLKTVPRCPKNAGTAYSYIGGGGYTHPTIGCPGPSGDNHTI